MALIEFRVHLNFSKQHNGTKNVRTTTQGWGPSIKGSLTGQGRAGTMTSSPNLLGHCTKDPVWSHATETEKAETYRGG